MASVLDMVKSGSGLFESANVANDKANTSTSVTPIESAVQGYNPDSVKMSGTPNQVRNAVRTGMDQTKDLSTAERQAAPRKTSNQTEKEKQAEAEKLAQLGTLRGRVQQIVDQKLTNAATGAELAIDDTKLPSSLSPEQGSQLKEAILVASGQKVSPNKSPAAALAEANNLLGKTADAMLNPEELKAYLVDGKTAAANKLAYQTADEMTVSELKPADLGFATFDDLAQTLGVDPQQLNGMSVNQFIKAVQDKTTADFSNMDRWRKVLADPTAGANEREEARRILREMGGTGERGTEVAMDRMSAEIQSGNRVNVGGTEYAVEELLKDENISQIAKNYFEDPSQAAAIKAQNPQLAAFFDRNAEILKEAAAGLEQTDAVLDASMADRNKMRTAMLDKLGGNRALAKLLIPDFDTVSLDQLEAPRLLESWGKMNTDQQAQISGVLSDLQQLGAPELVKELAGMDATQLQALGITNPAGAQQFKTIVNMSQKLASAEPADVDTVLDGIFGGPTYKQTLRDTTAARLAGINAASPMGDILDADHDGQQDDARSVLDRLKGYYGTNPIAAAAAGKTTRLPDVAGVMASAQGYQQDLYQAFRNDGALDGAERQNIVSKYDTARPGPADISALAGLASKDSGFVDAWRNASAKALDQAVSAVLGTGAEDFVNNAVRAISSNFDAMNTQGAGSPLSQASSAVGRIDKVLAENPNLEQSAKTSLMQQRDKLKAYTDKVKAAPDRLVNEVFGKLYTLDQSKIPADIARIVKNGAAYGDALTGYQKTNAASKNALIQWVISGGLDAARK